MAYFHPQTSDCHRESLLLCPSNFTGMTHFSFSFKSSSSVCLVTWCELCSFILSQYGEHRTHAVHPAPCLNRPLTHLMDDWWLYWRCGSLPFLNIDFFFLLMNSCCVALFRFADWVSVILAAEKEKKSSSFWIQAVCVCVLWIRLGIFGNSQ